MPSKEIKLLKSVGRKIKTMREELQDDQKSFAADCGISRTQLHLIERGKTNPRIVTLIKIANGLGVPLSELLTE